MITSRVTRVEQSLQILRTGIGIAEGPVSLACSFSLEDVAIIDLTHREGISIGIFAIDTGRLPEETFEVAESLIERYRLTIDWYSPRTETVEHLLRQKGPFSFRESLDSRLECCRIRKVEPLHRALSGLGGWVTGMRREHGVTRQGIEGIERDHLHGGIVKINPLVEWSEDDLLTYAADNRLPRNRLYERGYRSIGCAPCTRAVPPGGETRSGRWWWEDPEHRECGLHR